MRSSGGTNFELLRSVVSRTKSSIACFAGPSFHEGSTPLEAEVCAEADVRDVDKMGSNANVEISARRSTADCGTSPAMFSSPITVGSTYYFNATTQLRLCENSIHRMSAVDQNRS